MTIFSIVAPESCCKRRPQLLFKTTDSNDNILDWETKLTSKYISIQERRGADRIGQEEA